MEAREAAVVTLQRESGAVLIPPYNYGAVMCGQGTIALELLDQVSRRNVGVGVRVSVRVRAAAGAAVGRLRMLPLLRLDTRSRHHD